MLLGGSLVIGVACLLLWFRLRRQAQASLRWPAVPGKIVDSRLTQGDSEAVAGSKVARVKYAYAVGGTPFQASRVSFGNRSPHAVVQKYPAGAGVQVFYDPNKPGSAVLEPGDSGLKVLLIVGIVFVFAGLVLGALWLAQRNT